MANGVLGKVMTQSGTNVVAYTAPTGIRFATISINLTNTGSTDATVRIAIGTSATPGVVDYVEYDAVIPANGGILERSCMVVSANEIVNIFANSSLVACRVYGLEQV